MAPGRPGVDRLPLSDPACLSLWPPPERQLVLVVLGVSSWPIGEEELVGRSHELRGGCRW